MHFLSSCSLSEGKSGNGCGKRTLFSSFRVLQSEGYLKIAANSFAAKKASEKSQDSEEEENTSCNEVLLAALQKLKKNDILSVDSLSIKEGETSPPKRYNSGSMILAMEMPVS